MARSGNSKRAVRPNGEFYSSDPKERHAQLVEDGKLGGPGSELARQQGAKGGRPRKVRAAELIAQKARDEAERIWSVFEEAMDSEQPIRVRMEAAQAVVRIEKDEAALQLEEDKFDGMTEAELNQKMLEAMQDPELLRALTAEPADDEPEPVAIGQGFDDEQGWDA